MLENTAGAPAVFDPESIASLEVRLKASDLDATLSDSDPVGTWTSTVNSHSFEQSTAAKKPTFETNVFSTFSGVKFDGSDDFLESAANVSLDTSFTYFFVGTARGGDMTFDHGENGADGAWMYAGTNPACWVERSGSGDNYVATNENVYWGWSWSPQILMMRYDSGTRLWELKRGDLSYPDLGASWGTQGSATPAESSFSAILHIGARSNETLHHNGYMFEVMFYNEALSDADIANVYSYIETTYSQTQTSVDPSTVSSVWAWFKASDLDGSLNDGDSVTTWSDKKNSNDATQSTASKKPILKKSILNGKSVLRFDGSDDTLDFAAAKNISSGFLIAVASNNDATVGSIILGDNSPNDFFLLNTASSVVVYRNQHTKTIPDNALQATHQIYHVDINGTSTTIGMNGYTESDGAAAGAIDIEHIGTDISNEPNFIMDGDIAEIIICDSRPSDAEMNGMLKYLSDEYGIDIGLTLKDAHL